MKHLPLPIKALTRTKSRRLSLRWHALKVRSITLAFVTLSIGSIAFNVFYGTTNLAKAAMAPTREVEMVDKPRDVIREVEVDRIFTTEKQQIMAYLVQVFGDRADDAITMINTCENSSFSSQTINKGNNNGTWDVGVMQINVDPKNTEEVEKLKGYKYNIDRAYLKYKAHKNTFYLWSCGDRAGDYTYKMRLEGK